MKPTKKREHQRFVEAKIAGHSTAEAIRISGASETQCYEWLRDQATKDAITLGQAEGAAAPIEELDTGPIDIGAELEKIIASPKTTTPQRIHALKELSEHKKRVKPPKIELTPDMIDELVELVGKVEDWGARGRVMDIASRWWLELFPEMPTWTAEQLQRWDETGEVPSHKRDAIIAAAAAAQEPEEQTAP